MKYKLIFVFAVILLIGIVSADESFTFKQYENFTIDIVMANANLSSCTDCSCNVSVFYPDGSVYIRSAAGSNIGGYCRYTNEADKLGVYSSDIYFTNNIDHGRTSFEFEVTPSGFVDTLGFYILIVVLSLGVIILGLWKEDAPITILGTFGLYFLGIYTLFYGIAGIKDSVTTWAIGIITLGIAAYISIRAAYELITD